MTPDLSLPNDCLLLAVLAHQAMRSADIPARIMSVLWANSKQSSSHAVLFFEYEEQVYTYDRDGSMTLPASLRLNSPKLKLANAWARDSLKHLVVTAEDGGVPKVVRATWRGYS